MQRLKFILLFIIAVTMLQGCSFDEPPKDKADHETKDNETVVMIKQKIKLNLSEEKVKELFGEPFSIREANSIKTVPNNTEMWRYDFTKKEGGYISDRRNMEIDETGLKNGNMKAQLFVGWSGGESKIVNFYYIIYINNGDMYQYRVSPDGTEEVIKVSVK